MNEGESPTRNWAIWDALAPVGSTVLMSYSQTEKGTTLNIAAPAPQYEEQKAALPITQVVLFLLQLGSAGLEIGS